jgi:hypothetical protein
VKDTIRVGDAGQHLVEDGLMSSTDARFPAAESRALGRSSPRVEILRLASSMIGAGFLGATFGHGVGAIVGLVAGAAFGLLAVKNKPSEQKTDEDGADSQWRG